MPESSQVKMPGSPAESQSENHHSRSVEGKGVAWFLLSMAVVILAAGLVNQFGLKKLTRQAERGVMVTSEGVLPASHPLVARLQDVLYPGYREVLDRLDPPLFEASQFTLVNVLLENGKQVSFPYQWWLPLELAAEKSPHVVVFGSSRAREAVRPDILSQALDGKRVLNLAVSAATPGVMEVLADALAARLKNPVETIVIFIDDFAFSQEYADTETVWKGLIRRHEEKNSLTGRLSEKGRELLNLLPTWRRLPMQSPNPDYTPCADPEKLRAAGGEPPPAERKDWRLEKRALDSLARLAVKAEKLAGRVIFIATPVTDFQKRRAPGFDPFPAIESVLGQKPVSGDLEFWGLKTADFLGHGGGICGFDGHHMNGAAAVEFSRRLGRHLESGAP